MNPRLTTTGLLVLCVSAGVPAAWAQQSAAAPVGGYLSGNWGIARPAVASPTSVAGATEGVDKEEATTRFGWTTGPLFDVGGGVILGGRFTVGGAFERSWDTRMAHVDLTLTHPLFHPTLSATKATEPLERSEDAFHLEFGYRFPSRGPLAVRVFGGPTRFTVRQDMVSEVEYEETFNLLTRAYTATIESLDTDSVKGSGWGYNVGVDVSVFPSAHVGFGGLVRYTRATVDLENPLQSTVDDRTVSDPVRSGGLRVAGGLRIRF